MIKKISTILSSLLITLILINSALATSYTKPPLYSTAFPYIKYFQEHGSSSDFPGLTRSFLIDLGSSTNDTNIINYGASIYDQTITGMIELENNTTTILDTFVTNSQLIFNNPIFCTSSICTNKPVYRLLRLLGRSSGFGAWWNSWDWTIDTGATAYVIRYALRAYQKTLRTDYKDFAILLAGHLLAMQDTDGGIRMGPAGQYHDNGSGGSDPSFFWNTKSTEQNEQSLFALQLLNEINPTSQYLSAINALKTWLKNMYNKSTHLFYSASHFNGTRWIINLNYIATDANIFAPINMMFTDTFFGGTPSARTLEVEAMIYALERRTAFLNNNQNALLFRFSNQQYVLSPNQNINFGSVEWSAQMALLYLQIAQIYAWERNNPERSQIYLNKYQTLVSSLNNFFSTPSDDPNSKVAPYASYTNRTIASGVATGTGYFTFNCQAALASAYFAFAKAGYNPLLYNGGIGIPNLQGITFTPPSTPVVTDDGTSTTSQNQLHATWNATDPESDIAEYQYQITETSPSGNIIKPWTSVGLNTSATVTALSLSNGKKYYFLVKARNRIGLWSSIGYSNGITIINTFTITASSGSNGRISPVGTTNANGGSSQVFTIQPNAGYRIASVMIDGRSQGRITTYTFQNINANHTITATFERIPVPVITLSASASVVPFGNSLRLTWNATNNPTSCSASGPLSWSGLKVANGFQNVFATVAPTSTYRLTCTNGGGTATQSVSVAVSR